MIPTPFPTPLARRLAAALALLACAAAARAEAPYAFAATPGKLPKQVVPLDYRFTIAPGMDHQHFRGEEAVSIRVLAETREIVLNALDLRIDAASLSGKTLARVALQARLDEPRQTLHLALADPLPPGDYELAIRYRGRIGTAPQGLFYQPYPTRDGQRGLLATQMEPTDARRVLPCWDEPAFRATFQLTLELPDTLQAYSNMPAESRVALPGQRQRIRFARTPQMSSYLVAFVAGELERSTVVQGGVELGLVTTRGKQASARYALQASQALLAYFNDYFGLPYPLPKLDQIAVPGGFDGAMENWGSIIYADPLLLFDEATSDLGTRQDVYATLAHEIAHQWFGDLVTMAWWDNLWLNEGFASWMGSKATDHLNPGWAIWLQASDERERAMRLDASASARAVQHPVLTESDANDAFDDITYLKGQSFLRMLEAWVGEAPFRDGIRAYMSRHQYSNTTTADLWAALEQATGKPVARMAQGWITTPGYPLISVESACVDGQSSLRLAQRRFRSDGSPDDEARLWMVPVTVASAAAPQQARTVLLDSASTTVGLDAPCGDVPLVDPESLGYFRIAYSAHDQSALAARFAQLPDAARITLLSDTWARIGNGELPLTAFTDLMAHLGQDPPQALWQRSVEILRALDRVARDSPSRAALRAYGIALLRPQLDALGWDARAGESADRTLLRATLIDALGDFGDPRTVTEARQRFDRFIRQPRSLSPQIVDAVLGVVGRHADAARWKQLRGLLDGVHGTEQRQRYVTALSLAQDPTLATQALDLLPLDTRLPGTLALRVPRLVASEHPRLAWDWTQRHGPELMHRLTAFERNHFFGNVLAAADDVALAADLETCAARLLPADAMTETHRQAQAIRQAAQRRQRLLPQVQAAFPAESTAQTG